MIKCTYILIELAILVRFFTMSKIAKRVKFKFKFKDFLLLHHIQNSNNMEKETNKIRYQSPDSLYTLNASHILGL